MTTDNTTPDWHAIATAALNVEGDVACGMRTVDELATDLADGYAAGTVMLIDDDDHVDFRVDSLPERRMTREQLADRLRCEVADIDALITGSDIDMEGDDGMLPESTIIAVAGAVRTLGD